MKVVDLMVPANKFAETVEFYADGLGLESDTTETESIEFLIGSQKIKLAPTPGPLQRRDTHVSLHVHGLHECIRYQPVPSNPSSGALRWRDVLARRP